MRRIIIIILFLAYTPALFAELPVDFFIRSEYKKDTIDYSDTEKIYYGEKLTMLFSQESLFNFSCIYVDQTKEKKYTWNLVLKDISPNAYFIAGNYFANFGSGLLLGKKNLYDPDIFSIKVTERISEKNKLPFSPCNSGNPVFAFNGLAFRYDIQIYKKKLAFNLFYSIKERFISQDSYDSGSISSSMDTIDTTAVSGNRHDEPVEVHTGGILLSFDLFKDITVQSYFLSAGIKSRYKDKIAWEYESSYWKSSGTSGVNGFGLFAQYRDDFLCILTDGAMTQTETLINNKKENINGYAMLYRIAFSPPFLAMAITGKEVQSTFYSPYSSSIGADYPESAWFFDTEIKPYTNLKFQTKISSEKKKSPSSRDAELPAVRKENITLSYHYKILEEFEIIFKRREKTDNSGEERRQIHSTANMALTKTAKINFSAAYQYDRNINPSKVFGAGFQLLLTGHLRINAHFITAYISNDNPVYTTASPIRDASTQGFFIRQDSNTVVAKCDFRVREIFLSGRWLYQFDQNNSLYKQLEFFASGYF
jgi:hypothetical protein